MDRLYRASVDTHNFSFETYGHSSSSALVCLRQGLFKHAEKFAINPAKPWVDEVAADANVTMYTFGEAYRDGCRIE